MEEPTKVRKAVQKTTYKKPSPAVLRRRRLVVFIILLLLVGLVAVLISAGIGYLTNSSANKQDTQMSAEETPSESDPPVQEDKDSADTGSSSVPSSHGKCATNKINVTASSDKEVYLKDEKPKITAELENTNDADCDINLGTTGIEYTAIRDGKKIFDSKDCSKDPQEIDRALAPGAKISIDEFIWQRTQTQSGCPKSAKESNKAPAGNYEMVVNVDGHKSKPIKFELKNSGSGEVERNESAASETR